MRSPSFRGAVTAAVASAVCLLTLGSAGSSFAGSPAAVDGDAPSGDIVVTAPARLVVPAPSAPDPGALRTLEVGLRHGGPAGTLTPGVFTVDAGGLARIAEVIWPAGCTHARGSAVAKCDLRTSPSNPGKLLSLRIHSLVGARAGAHGVITYTPKGAPGGARAVRTTVSVGSGPDVVTSAPFRLRAAAPPAPGATVVLPFTLTNAGNETAPGAIVRIYGSRGLAWSAAHSNCESLRTPPSADFPASASALCVLDQPLAPGATYAFADPPAFLAESFALWERTDLRATAKSADALADAHGNASWTKGTGTPLRLVPRPGPSADDLYQEDNFATTAVAVRNTADLAVTGSRVSGTVGRRVTAAVTVTNHGPAAVSDITVGNPVVAVDIRVPAGTTVVKAPKGCRPVRPNDEDAPGAGGAPQYTCETKNWLDPGESAVFPFQLRIDRAIDDSAGSATLQIDHDPNSRTNFDTDPGDNTAVIAVTGDRRLLTRKRVALAGGLTVLALGAGAVVLRRRRARSRQA